MDRYLRSADVLKTLRQLLYETALNSFDFGLSDVYEDIAKNRLETWVSLIPPADVVDKEQYDRLLENATIISEALNKYQTTDVVPVIRCNDCRHLSENRIAPDWHRICRLQGVGKTDDGFCDEAERKENTI